MYDADSLAVEYIEDAVNFEYEIKVLRLMSGYSMGLIQVGGTASVTVTKPQDYIKSSEPLSGNLRIKCIDYTGEQNYSTSFSYSSRYYDIENKIMLGCDRFVDRVQVFPSGKFAYNENGLQLILTFRGYDNDPGQFEIELDEGTTIENQANIIMLG